MKNLFGKNIVISTVIFLALLLLINISSIEAITIKQVRVAALGHNDTNTIQFPIFISEGLAPLAIRTLTSSYDPKAKIVRGIGTLFTKPPSLNLDSKINLATLFTKSLQAEAKVLGIPLAASEPPAEMWTVSGNLTDIYLETSQASAKGWIMFWGFMDLALEIEAPDGTADKRRYRVHTYQATPPGSPLDLTGKQEAALAIFLVEGAQEVLSRLNREFFKAPASPDIEKKVEKLAASGVKKNEAELHLAGLSGTSRAVSVLLSLLPKEKDHTWRCLVINALGRAGALEAVNLLSERYAQEEELCRWYTLKAWDDIGTEQALALIKEKGPKDNYGSVMILAARILGTLQ